MTERPLYKTEFPFYLLNQFILPIALFISFLMFKLEEMILICSIILFVVSMSNLGYNEYNVFTDRITIVRKNLFFHFKTTLIEIPFHKIIDMEFEKGFFDKTVFILSKISFLLLGPIGRGKTDNDHIVTITYKDEFTTETHTEVFNFDYRIANLEDLVNKTKLKIRKGK